MTPSIRTGGISFTTKAETRAYLSVNWVETS